MYKVIDDHYHVWLGKSDPGSVWPRVFYRRSRRFRTRQAAQKWADAREPSPLFRMVKECQCQPYSERLEVLPAE